MKKPLLLSLFAAGLIVAAQTETSAQFTQIGQTTYDLQSNASSGNRIVRHSDGTISTVWTEQCTVSGGTWPDRGIGYNYRDAGGTWLHGTTGTCPDPFGISSLRVGWPEVTAFSSGKEYVISHTPLRAVSRPQKGTGGLAAWTPTTALTFSGAAPGGQTWPRMVRGSDNVAHIIASDAGPVNGVTAGIAYLRSTDEGVTWTEVPLPGHNTTNFNGIGGDAYAIHANGSVVAITAGDSESNWMMWKSTDSGLTWTSHMIRQFDINDTVMTAAGAIQYASNDPYQAVVVDNSGRVHVFAGLMVYGLEASATEPNGWSSPSYYPTSEGLWYWSDAMAPNSATLIVTEIEDIYPTGHPLDYVGDGSYLSPAVYPRYYGSNTGMPNAAVAPNGDVYLVLSSTVEGTSNNLSETGQSYRDIYVMKGVPTAAGIQWSTMVNMPNAIPGGPGRTEFDERVFPSVAHEMGADNILHMLWQQDDEPGLHVRGDLDPETVNTIMYYGLNVNTVTFPTGVFVPFLVGLADAANYVNGITAYPNPTAGQTMVQVDLKQNSNIQIRVVNMLGQEVATLAARELESGVNTLAVDLSAQPAGIYMYTVSSDNFTVTNRLVKH